MRFADGDRTHGQDCLCTATCNHCGYRFDIEMERLRASGGKPERR